MAIDNSFIIKKLQGLPEMFVIFSQSTKHPYVTCNEESFDDQIHIFSDAEAAHAYVVAKNEQEKIPVVSVRVAAEQKKSAKRKKKHSEKHCWPAGSAVVSPCAWQAISSRSASNIQPSEKPVSLQRVIL